MDLVVFICSSFREGRGGVRRERVAQNIRPGCTGRRAAPDQGMDAGANPASFFAFYLDKMAGIWYTNNGFYLTFSTGLFFIAYVLVRNPDEDLFFKILLTALARCDIMKVSIRLPRGIGVDPGFMLGCHLIDGHFHPSGESCE